MPIAIMMTAAGDPHVLQAKDVVVRDPPPGEVQIRQTVVGVNFVDIYYRTGLYPLAETPAVLGLEGAGRVEMVGSGVTTLRRGDRVAYMGAPLGAYAELRNLPEARLIHLPDSISDRVAGSTMLRGLTAHMLLHKVYAVRPGDWLLVHAAAGGLGQIVTRWGKRMGANVIGTVGSEAKHALARNAGADLVLLHTEQDWVDKARQFAGGKGVHLAVDGIGGQMLTQTLGCVRPFGIVASLGQPAGPIPAVRVEDLGFARSIALMRPSSIAYANDPSLYLQGARDLLAALEDGLTNPIGAEYSLRDAARAHEDLEAGRTTGSVILDV
ncbi:quinone oxidoreductase family protein [Lichenifustis flavocetrariae]|uniref:Quinone oxidoreductase n=1 Tax=Lichenifustis flavocetrariae TaxID=2949735 RepID=A0AA42CPR3_9HYPH|nr:quinone oxidoreductase [Lichenifustis flavocetrariae]MCW6510670.1 quinone oxidoreductase [Lichenifustis flavocetrariae]